MIRDVLIPELAERFPGRGLRTGSPPSPLPGEGGCSSGELSRVRHPRDIRPPLGIPQAGVAMSRSGSNWRRSGPPNLLQTLKLVRLVIVAACLFAGGIAGAQDDPSIRLLPTDRESARVRVLEDALDKHLTGDVPASYNELKEILKDFVIRQLNVGGNGLGNWKATVYSCDQEGVHRIWQMSDLHGLTAFAPGASKPSTVKLVSRETRDF
jgi:hypothetical protein